MKFSIFSIVVIVLSSITCVYGQKKTSFVCFDAEIELTRYLQTWSKTTRTWGDDCMIMFKKRDRFLSVDIEDKQTIEKSRKDFSVSFDYLTLAETYPKSVKSIKSSAFWDESKGFHHDSDPDHLIMLRYKRIVITLIGSQYDALLGTESVLRKIDFEGNNIK